MRWTRERVASMRSNFYRIPVFKPDEDGIEPWLNLGQRRKAPEDRAQDAQARR